MMKKCISFISLTQIFPPRSGGEIRSSNLIGSLSDDGYEVKVYCLTGRKKDYRRLSKNVKKQEITPSIEQIVYINPITGLLQYLCYRLNFPNIWASRLLLSIGLPSAFKKHIRDSGLVIIDTPHAVNISKYVGKNRLFLLSHNVEKDCWKHKRFGWLKARVAHMHEKKAAKHVSTVMTCEKTESFYYRQLGADDVIVIPNDARHINLPPKRSEYYAKIRDFLGVDGDEVLVLFSASRYEPNIEALSFLRQFISDYFYELKLLKYRFLVAGSVCDRPFEESLLIATGAVSDIKPYFWAADCAINPVIHGSGTNVKVAEYLRARLPILSTSFGARGYRFKHNVDGILFDRLNLLQALQRFSKLDPKERNGLVSSCYTNNAQLLSMDYAVRQMLLPKIETISQLRSPLSNGQQEGFSA
jgi:hypothetical protein